MSASQSTGCRMQMEVAFGSNESGNRRAAVDAYSNARLSITYYLLDDEDDGWFFVA
jgi:hypothetical protein